MSDFDFQFIARELEESGLVESNASVLERPLQIFEGSLAQYATIEQAKAAASLVTQLPGIELDEYLTYLSTQYGYFPSIPTPPVVETQAEVPLSAEAVLALEQKMAKADEAVLQMSDPNEVMSRQQVDYLHDVQMQMMDPVPKYRTTLPGEVPGSLIYEQFNEATGKRTSARVRNRLGQLGRSLTKDRKLTEDIKNAMRAALLENYDREFKAKHQTGTLRRSISEGAMDIDPDQVVFKFTLADLLRTREDTPETSRHREVRTWYYGPRVFQGRPPILLTKGSGFGPMVFRNKENTGFVSRWVVKAGPPKNIFELTKEQQARIDVILVKGVTDEIRGWMRNLGVL